jgi:NAD(P)-dependent dehydrogenase (short-subunit alcohol dehydrogenase family)
MEIVVMVFIADKTVLVTGANRGIGQALIEEILKRGARQVYAGTRTSWTHADQRVTPLTLDVTDAGQVERAVEQVESLDVLVNNAGVAAYDDLSDRDVIEWHLAVNLFGTHRMVEAFLPLLVRSGGAIVNNLSVNALAPFPVIPSYGISKAAAFSMTQSLRALLADRGVSVHAVLTGIIDTEMSAAVDVPKASPESVAQRILDGVEKDEEDIFPDPMAESLIESWRGGAVKALERQNAAVAGAILAAQTGRS